MFCTLELIERKSFEYKIVDDLEQISFLLNILQREQVSLSVRLYRNIWCSYYSLLSPSSVWSESSSSRTKNLSLNRVASTRRAVMHHIIAPGALWWRSLLGEMPEGRTNPNWYFSANGFCAIFPQLISILLGAGDREGAGGRLQGSLRPPCLPWGVTQWKESLRLQANISRFPNW